MISRDIFQTFNTFKVYQSFDPTAVHCKQYLSFITLLKYIYCFLLIMIFLMIREIRYELEQKGYTSGKDSLLSKNRIRPNMARVIEP